MNEILFQYERVNPTSWAYLSSLLVIALFFKFNRLFCVRNLDLLLLIFLAPGLLCIEQAFRGEVSDSVSQFGFYWLFGANALLLVRSLADSSMVRRPLLEPNLSVGGLGFLTLALLFFLTVNVLKGDPYEADLYAVQRAEHLSQREASELEQSTLDTHGPGFSLLFVMPHISTRALIADPIQENETVDAVQQPDNPGNVITARVMAILCQVLIVTGILLIAARHFENATLGLAAGTLYLLLPYTALWNGNVTHALPGALLVWAIALYRRPFFSGIMIGLACGAIYYPFALLPLWITFYWRRGLKRFITGFVLTLIALVVTLVFTSTDTAMFLASIRQMFGVTLPTMDQMSGVWQYWNGWYRVPVIAAFFGLGLSFAMWPAQKNLGTLLSCSAALMLSVQFWHAHSGGLALAWYLPLLLLVVFRTNLEDRTAANVVAPTRWDREPTAAAA